MAAPSQIHSFLRHLSDDTSGRIDRAIAVETPVAVEFNGIGYAVMMATPDALDDFAYGFALSERLISRADQVVAVDQHSTDKGMILRVTLSPDRVEMIAERVRHRVAESSCGMCGIENLEQAMRPLQPVTAQCDASESAVFKALAMISTHQLLNAETGAVHAAALCGAGGEVRLVREDVGRHNAFDKLIGAMLRAGLGWNGGFALTTARCSYELVEKAVLANCPMLVAISAPTSLAIARANQAGLRLMALARPDSVLRA